MTSQATTGDGTSRRTAKSRSNALARTDDAKPMLLFFYSPTCGHSRRAEGFLAQVLQRRQNHDTFAVRHVDCEKRPDLAARFGVKQLPALVVVEHKRVCGKAERPGGCVEIRSLLSPWLK